MTDHGPQRQPASEELPPLTAEEKAALDSIDLTPILGTPDERIERANAFAMKMFRERNAMRDELARLRAENGRLKADAARWQYVRDELSKSNSLHMDGTAFFRLRSPGLRGRSLEEVIDALRGEEG
jgi:hypothetical protein